MKKWICVLLAALLMGGCTSVEPSSETSYDSDSDNQSVEISSEEEMDVIDNSSISEEESDVLDTSSVSEEEKNTYSVLNEKSYLIIPENEHLEQFLLTDTGDYLLVVWVDKTHYMRKVSKDGEVLAERTQGSSEPAYLTRRPYGFEQGITKYSSVRYYDFDLQDAWVHVSTSKIPAEVIETVPGGFESIGWYKQYMTGYSPITYSTDHPSPPMFPENGSIGRYDTEKETMETIQLPIGCEPSEIVGDGRFYALRCTVSEDNRGWIEENVLALRGNIWDDSYIFVFDMDTLTITGYVGSYSVSTLGGYAAISPDGTQMYFTGNQRVTIQRVLPA